MTHSCPTRRSSDLGNQAPDDASGRHFVKRDLKGLEPVMPLEPGASGMVVYTQAFAIGRKLTEDSARIEQEYLVDVDGELASDGRSEEHTSELQSLMRNSYAVFCWKKKNKER